MESRPSSETTPATGSASPSRSLLPARPPLTSPGTARASGGLEAAEEHSGTQEQSRDDVPPHPDRHGVVAADLRDDMRERSEHADERDDRRHHDRAEPRREVGPHAFPQI